MFYGPGAGGEATSAAAVSDLVDIARNYSAGKSKARAVAGFHQSPDLQLCDSPHPVGWFLRLTVKDQPGIISRVAEVIAHEALNIHSVIQEPGFPIDQLPFVVTVEAVSEPLMRRAVEKIDQFPFMCEPVLVLRIN